MSSKSTSAKVERPEIRLAYVRAFMQDRQVQNYVSVFRACGVKLSEDDVTRLRELWNAKAAIDPTDLPMIDKLEKAVEHLKAA